MNEEILEEKELLETVLSIVKHPHSFTEHSARIWGNNTKVEKSVNNYYQLKPNGIFNFFDWYCENRCNFQFFKSKNLCVLNYLFYWSYWHKIGKPSPTPPHPKIIS